MSVTEISTYNYIASFWHLKYNSKLYTVLDRKIITQQTFNMAKDFDFS